MFWCTLSRKINNHFTNTNMNRGIKDLRLANSFETPTALSKNVAVGSMSFDFHCTNDYYLNDTRTQFVFVQNHISTSANNRSFQQFLSRKLAQITKYICVVRINQQDHLPSFSNYSISYQWNACGDFLGKSFNLCGFDKGKSRLNILLCGGYSNPTYNWIKLTIFLVFR